MKYKRKRLLEHAVIKQIETDILYSDFDAISATLALLIKNKKSRNIFKNYLSDTTKENWIKGRTPKRY